jgi:8-oxo-dGTP diphosphatase
MTTAKTGQSNGQEIHYSVGAIIKRNNEYLLIDRVKEPLGFAGVAGHIDENETPEQSLIREVKEESGLEVIKPELLIEEFVQWNECSHGVKGHYWYLYTCEVSGDIEPSIREAKSINWYTKDEITKLKLEPVWEYWFKKLEII